MGKRSQEQKTGMSEFQRVRNRQLYPKGRYKHPEALKEEKEYRKVAMLFSVYGKILKKKGFKFATVQGSDHKRKVET